MDTDAVRVGVVGCGGFGLFALQQFVQVSGVQLVAMAGTHRPAALAAAQRFGLANLEDVEKLVTSPDIDLVYIATPPFLHHPQALAALEAGKHVICEKPLAMNTRESAELVQLAGEKKLVNAVNFNIRMYPLVQQARSMVQGGELGDLFILQGSYLQDWLLFPTDWNWRLEPELGGSLRAVRDIGSHWLDLLGFITSLRVDEVYADIKTVHPVRKKPAIPLETYSGKLLQPSDFVDQPVHTEDYATILLHYEHGARGVLTVSQVSSGHKNRLYYEINGSKSSLAWDSERPNEMWVGHRTAPNQVLMKDPALLSPEARAVTAYPGGHNEGFLDTFKQLYNKVYNYILAGDYARTPDFPTFADGHYEMQVCEAIERSVRQNTWVKVE